MNKEIFGKIKSKVESFPLNIVDGMLMMERRPHTASVEHLSVCGEGRQTGAYYFLARYFDLIDDETAESIAKEVVKLQNTDEGSVFYGCMRWYREEPYISDTNGAFFVMLPFALAYFLCEEKLTPAEKDAILLMLSRGGVWFSRACRGSLYYTNKVTSDGALLALISRITGEYTEECKSFWRDWLSFVDAHGFGWGENTSDVYTMITINALSVALLALDGELLEKIKAKRRELIKYVSFHGDGEFIPSIRTYNFKGEASLGGSIYKALMYPDGLVNLSDLMSAVAIGLSSDDDFELFEKERFGVERAKIFNDSYAYTYKTESVRLGSISKFPAMPACYQNKGWGLGWQSMPVSAMVGNSVSFVRLGVMSGGVTRTHPAEDKHSAHLMSRLFTDNNPPSYFMRASQNENKLVFVRRIANIANTAEYIFDSWCIPGNPEIKEICKNENRWYIIDGKIAVCPKRCIGVSDDERVAPKVKITKRGEFTYIESVLYEGEERLIFKDYIESALVVVAINDESELDYITITDEDIADRTHPRAWHMKKRKLSVSDKSGEATLEFEPYEALL